jgi:hypothetical protein
MVGILFIRHYSISKYFYILFIQFLPFFYAHSREKGLCLME